MKKVVLHWLSQDKNRNRLDVEDDLWLYQIHTMTLPNTHQTSRKWKTVKSLPTALKKLSIRITLALNLKYNYSYPFVSLFVFLFLFQDSYKQEKREKEKTGAMSKLKYIQLERSMQDIWVWKTVK